MKSVSLAAQAIACGAASVAVAGGMESMSRAPHLVRGLRGGLSERAVEAVKQWRFSAGRMKGVPVDVVVQVGVEFKLR